MNKEVRYQKINDSKWWCKTHNRQAEFIRHGLDNRIAYCCDPALGGIMMPCDCEKR